MIVGIANNLGSSVAADTNANQTTIQVLPGDGARFAKLLTTDYTNSSVTPGIYGKVTLFNQGKTDFEICHVLSISGDILTVARAQEGTTAKGWPLNSGIGSLPTRGTTNQHVQIENLQNGSYTSAIATGTANGLVVDIPSSFFMHNATDWTLRAPLVIYSPLNNTGATTIQMALGGRVLGPFPIYKGNQQQLSAGDIIANAGAVCVMDITGTFFNLINPASTYGAFVKKTGDTMTGPLAVTSDEAALLIRPKTAGAGNYLLAKDSTGGNQFYVGKGSASDDGCAFQNYKGSNSLVLRQDGTVSINVGATVPSAIGLNGNTTVTGNVVTTGAVTPANYANFDARYLTKSLINTASKSANGWFKDGSTGIIFQWMNIPNANNTASYPLPIAFPNAGLFCIGWVNKTVPTNQDAISCSAALVNASTVSVTTDFGFGTEVLAIGY